MSPETRLRFVAAHKAFGYHLAYLLSGLFSLVLIAQESPSDENLKKLKGLSLEQIMQIEIPTVYGAAKHEQKTTEAPSAVSVITREEIQAYGHRTLAEVLRSVRDLYVGYDRNYGYVGVRGFNRPGDFGGRVLILIDGHRLNEPVFDSAGVVTDFPVDVDMIERVEVIRGPGSALYGNNAFFAVINVVTRTAAELGGGEFSGEAGSFDTFKGRLSYGHVFKSGLSMLLSATEYDSAGPDLYFKEFDKPGQHHGEARGLDGDHYDSAMLNLHFEDFTLQGGYVSRHKDVPTAALDTVFGDPRFYTVDQRSQLDLGYEHDFDGGWCLHADVYWNTYYYDGDYPVIRDKAEPRQTTLNHDVVHAQWWGGELRLTKQVFEHHLLTLGAEMQDNSMLRLLNYDESPRFNYLRTQTSNSTFGIYAQDEWQLIPSLTLTAGLRYDAFDWAGSATNPRAGLVWHPYDKTTLKFLYGEALRVPNVYESAFMADTHRSNPDLDPERTRSYEVEMEQELSPSLRLSVSAFRSRISNLISQQIDASTGKLFFDNVQEAETTGGSVELEARLPYGLKGRVSYTLQHTSDWYTGMRLSNSPDHLAKLGLMAPILGDRLVSGLEVQATSGVSNTRGGHVSGYVLANWTLLAKQLTPRLDVSASVYNLFDTRYSFPGGPEHTQDSLLQDGRTFRLKFTYRF
ncbi:MAG: TonB-dependent receptor [Verrucomicrobiaceae bacterium]|nr:TonB-dependent receptor [Verrucomicrobiaceae bacterium]